MLNVEPSAAHAPTNTGALRCRACNAVLRTVFADLGKSPLSNALLDASQLFVPEMYYPLCAYVCDACMLVQLPAVASREQIFSDYAYFSSYSSTWIEHAARFAQDMVKREALGTSDLIVEIASNDGYLLREFLARDCPVLGIEPARNVAAVAEAQGVRTLAHFFGTALAEKLVSSGYRPRLVVANNVLAHVPDLHDFVGGVAVLLGSDDRALATFEFPHLLRLIERCQYDTIYHEHFSYFSLLALEPIFAQHGLAVADVEELPTHGGSLRLIVRLRAHTSGSAAVDALRACERAAGLDRLDTYVTFGQRIVASKRSLLSFLLEAQAQGRTVAAYGAPAKGNTLLTYCGVRSDLISFTVDLSPYKQGRYLPGSQLAIYAPDALVDARPDYVLILPWNIADEVMEQMHVVRSWGGRFATAIPSLTIHA